MTHDEIFIILVIIVTIFALVGILANIFVINKLNMLSDAGIARSERASRNVYVYY